MSSQSSILIENPKAENESWEEWGEKLALKYKTPANTPNLPLVPGQDKLRTSSVTLSPSLIDSDNSIFPYSRDLGGIRNSVEGVLQREGRRQAHPL